MPAESSNSSLIKSSSLVNKFETLLQFRNNNSTTHGSPADGNMTYLSNTSSSSGETSSASTSLTVGSSSSHVSLLKQNHIPRKQPVIQSSQLGLSAEESLITSQQTSAEQLITDYSRSASSSSLSVASSSFRRRKPSQSSSLFSTDSTKNKPSDIMLHLNESKLSELLEDMLDQMGLDENKREAVRTMPKDAKWMMVYQHMQKMDDAIMNNSFKGSPEAYAKQLKEFSNKSLSSAGQSQACCKILSAIRVCLASQPIVWVKQFIVADGLKYLLLLVDRLSSLNTKKDWDFTLELELLRCLKAFMNSKYGLRDIMHKAPKSVVTISKCLVSTSFAVKKLTAELLTVICYTDTPHGQKLVWDAMNDRIDGDNYLYEIWLSRFLEICSSKEKIGAKGGLIAGVGWVGDNRVTDKEISEFLVSHTILANAIISLLSDVDYRVSIRNKLYVAGFGNIIVKLEEIAVGNEYVRRQVEQFQNDMANDWKIISANFEDLKSHESDPREILHRLITQTQDTRGFRHLVSILQNLLCIRREPAVRSSYLQLIDILVSQVIFNGKGVDPDFSAAYPLDLGIIIDNFVHHDDLTRLNHENSLLKQMTDKLLAERSLREDNIKSLYNQDSDLRVSEKFVSKLNEHHDKLRAILNQLQSIPSSDLEKNRVVEKEFEIVQRRDSMEILESSASHVLDTSNEMSKRVDQKLIPERKDSSETVMSVPPPPPPPPPPALAGLFKGQMPGVLHSRKPPKAAAYTPKTKLKQMQWEKIPDNRISETFWSSIDDKWISEKLSKIGLWQELEKDFADVRPVANFGPSNSASNEQKYGISTTLSNNQTVSKDISVIDSKKAYNLTILLSRLKQSPSDLGNAILQMDTEILSASLTHQLLNYVPTAEESGLLSPYLDDDSTLAVADKFVLKMMNVDRCHLRLKCLNFRYIYNERIIDIESGLLNLTQAIESISCSHNIKDFLQLLLVIGNVMNGKGFRGGAYGFRVSSLNSLVCTKTSNGRTILDFISKVCINEFPEFVNIPDELESVSTASRVSIQCIQEEFKHLFKQAKSLDHELSKNPPSESDSLTLLHEFIKRSLIRLEKCGNNLESCTKNFEEMLKQFGDDPKEMTSEDWFGILKSFLVTFRKSITNHVQQLEIDSKKASSSSTIVSRPPTPIGKQPERSQNSKFISTDSPTKSMSSSSNSNNTSTRNNDCQGVMDDLLDSLRNGTVPKGCDKTPKRTQLRRVSNDFEQQANELLIELNKIV